MAQLLLLFVVLLNAVSGRYRDHRDAVSRYWSNYWKHFYQQAYDNALQDYNNILNGYSGYYDDNEYYDDDEGYYAGDADYYDYDDEVYDKYFDDQYYDGDYNGYNEYELSEMQPTFYRAEALNSAQSKIGQGGGFNYNTNGERQDIGIGIGDANRARDFAVSSIMQGFPDTVVKSWEYTGNSDVLKKVREDSIIEDFSTDKNNVKYKAANEATDGTKYRPLHVDIAHGNDQYMFPKKYAIRVLGHPPAPTINYVPITTDVITAFANKESAKYKRWFVAAAKKGKSTNQFKQDLANNCNAHNALYLAQLGSRQNL